MPHKQQSTESERKTDGIQNRTEQNNKEIGRVFFYDERYQLKSKEINYILLNAGFRLRLSPVPFTGNTLSSGSSDVKIVRKTDA